MLTIHVEVRRHESPALVGDATSDLPVLILGSPGNLFLSLGFETQVTVKKKNQDCGVGGAICPATIMPLY